MDTSSVTITHYRLSKTLGIGAFGKVKLAEHVISGHQVAVKILNKGKIQALEMDEKVKREINILKLCKSPHIIRLYEVVDTPSEIFVVMEYAPGGELFDYIVSKGRPSPEEAQRLFQQIVSAVEFCHYHHIVHRDLKPENLLLDKDNNLKIADFGLSNMMRDGEFLRTSCGSPNYAAPEVIMGNLYAGPEVDVWSCGVILYALLCGSLPFDDESIPSLFKKIKSGMYSLPSHLSPLTRDLIPRMLVVDPMKRITIPEIRQHPWFLQNLPSYLALSPSELKEQETRVDTEVADQICRLGFKGATRAKVAAAVVQRKPGKAFDDIRVCYEMLLGNKHTKERLEDCVVASKRANETPPAFTPSRRLGGSPNRFISGLTNTSAHPGGSAPSQQLAEVSSILHRQQGSAHDGSRAGGGVTAQQQGPGQGAPSGLPHAKRRRWYLGIQSKKDPAHVMTEVYRALLQLGCEWSMKSSYRINCRWRPNLPSGGVFTMGLGGGHGQAPQGKGILGSGYRIIVGLTLYKVQQNIYLLDFQRKEGDQFSFMTLCAKIITQLKTLSAASKAMQISQANSGGHMPVAVDPRMMMQQQGHPQRQQHKGP